MPDKLKLFLETLPRVDAVEVQTYFNDNEFALDEVMELVAESARE